MTFLNKKMETWREFETKCELFLKEILNNSEFEVIKIGGSDANEVDLLIKKQDLIKSKIEIKLSPSQSGQLVVFAEKSDLFSLSTKIRSENIYSIEIINKLNQLYKPSSVGKTPLIKLDIDKDLLFRWIIEHYKNKGVQFFITSKNKNTKFFAIIPITELPIYFNAKLILRNKKSGTRDVPIKDILVVQKLISNHFEKNGIKVDRLNYEYINKKLFLKTTEDIFHTSYINSYYLSKIDDYKYRIKVLSNTNNINLIFNLEYIGPEKTFGLDDLLMFLT
jgi:hypothetical protein